ncbi:LamB/YcsF family protein [Arthrobacter sp. NPDC056727]|uniref:LamB/YcsF family protein n=1 Tax=Arthrobacter sp. NPDC056727 TaxID=3345927 RepID=UPI00366B57FD
MTQTLDLVADVGESFGAYTLGDDEALLGVLTSANVACGFHAGDPQVMDRTVAACRRRGVAVGAHPSFPDRHGFGRRAMALTEEEVRLDVMYQIGALSAFTAAHGMRIQHVTPHGALGNLVVTRADYARAVIDAATTVHPDIIFLAQEGELADLARQRGLPLAIFGIADRNYEDDGTLVSRSKENAVLHDPDLIAARTVRMVTEGIIDSIHGRPIPIQCDSILLHGDNPDSIEVARKTREALLQAGVRLAPVAEILHTKVA